MKIRFTAQAVLFASFAVMSSFPLYAAIAYQKITDGTAVDIKGVRHTAREYPGHHGPWDLADRIKAVAPAYTYEDRARHRQGSGFFAVFIDANTGVPTRVTIIKSTGHPTLDQSAIEALQRWRWKPGRWKEVDLPVTFTMAPGPKTPPPGAVRLPSRW
jgi:TonB family protein